MIDVVHDIANTVDRFAVLGCLYHLSEDCRELVG
jgi:hypothetical protein